MQMKRQNPKMKSYIDIVVKKGWQVQMARNLPRGSRRSLVRAVFLLHDHDYDHHQPLNSHNAFYSQFHKHKTPQEGMEDQVRKEVPSKLVSDYILPHILNLYASRATPKDFEIYAPNATFEDPLMRAHGVKQIKSAFYSLAKIFSESRIVDYSIMEKETSPGKTEILIDNKQYYKFLGKDINMISLIKLDTEDGKVVLHQDRWDKKPLWDRETVKVPLVGHVIEATRRASMLATHALMGFGKDPST